MNKNSIFITLALASSISVSSVSWALAPVNSVNDGQIIQGGTYYNTPDSKTTFINSAHGGLWLKSGTEVRGLEVNAANNLTNNGGNILIDAPKDVVRLDGNINVNGILNGQGAYLGNGGNVSVNAAYLFQSGNIYAMGTNGGHVQMNVNSATFGPQSKIDASGAPNGLGGTIRITATGVVNVQKNAQLVTNGVTLPGVDSNVIEVSGGLVNNAGIIQANGISTNIGQNHNAGMIRLVANGCTNLKLETDALYQTTVMTPTESNAALQDLKAQVSQYDGSVYNTGAITADGGARLFPIPSAGGNGGIISIKAYNDILNTQQSVISASGGPDVATLPIPIPQPQGGHGGNIALQACRLFKNDGLISVNGGPVQSAANTINSRGGGAGSIYVNANTLLNTATGKISATGGPGGLGVGTVGGDGGRVALWSYNASHASRNDGLIEANGREGSAVLGSGGVGGHISLMNIDNGGTVRANGGFGQFAKTGGTIDLTHVINTGNVIANGGDSVGVIGSSGGTGGTINVTNVTNTGVIAANGGLGVGLNVDLGVPLAAALGGRGGTINNAKVLNFGNIQANGGSAAGLDILAGAGAGGNGGTINSTDMTNNGGIQANGGDGSGISTFLKIGTGGAGGSLISTNITNNGFMHANGGAGNGSGSTSPSVIGVGFGGAGGQITSTSITNNGNMEANGGNGNNNPLNLIATGFGGAGGHITLNVFTSKGEVLANGGSGYLAGNGGVGGRIDVNNSLRYANSGLIQANGGFDDLGAGGSGGTIFINGLFNDGVIEANGGTGRLTLNGSHGGSMNLKNMTNNNLIQANGGDNGLPAIGTGGTGGSIVMSNITNNAGKTIQVNGGFGNRQGGQGGNISANNVINNGLIAADGRGSAKGGKGGVINVSNFVNAGTVEANGGNSSFIFTNGGDGGSVTGVNVTNTGTATAKGGSGGPAGGSGADGPVVGF